MRYKYYAVRDLITGKYFDRETESGIKLSWIPVIYRSLEKAKTDARKYNSFFINNRGFVVVELTEKVVEDDHD